MESGRRNAIFMKTEKMHPISVQTEMKDSSFFKPERRDLLPVKVERKDAVSVKPERMDAEPKDQHNGSTRADMHGKYSWAVPEPDDVFTKLDRWSPQ